MRSVLPRSSQSEQVGRPTGGNLVNAPPGCGDDAIPGSRNAKRAAYMDVQREDTASWYPPSFASGLASRADRLSFPFLLQL